MSRRRCAADCRVRLVGWFAFVAAFAAGTPAARAQTVTLSLTERSGVHRVGEPVTSGVPIAAGLLTRADHVRLLHRGKEVPAQFRATGLWRPHESIRWLLVDFQADLAAKQTGQYTLQFGPGVSTTLRPRHAVRIDEDDQGYTIDTGAAVFRLSKRAFSLFEEVRLAEGGVVVARPAPGEARHGAVVRGLRAMATCPVPHPANRGRSHLIYVQPATQANPDDYTLRFVSDRQYEVRGAKSGAVGKGEYLKDFTSDDGRLAIPRDAWLQYAWPKQGDQYTFRTIPQGASAVSEGVSQTAVLERGPLRSVIRVQGSFGPVGAAALEFTAWYHFFAGSGRVKLAMTLENNAHGGRTSTGNAHNADIGGVNCVFFDEMLLRLPLALASPPRVCLGASPDREPLAGPLSGRVELYQDSSGGDHWDCYRDARFHPRPNSYVSFRGYRVFVGDAVAASGDRALGWIDVSDATRGVTAAVQDFWQNFPKALAAQPDGALEIGLFPGRYAADFPLRSGEHKTHEVLLVFHAGPPGAEGNKALAQAFSDPLRLEAPPAYYASTRALGRLHPFDPDRYRAYELRNLSTVGQAASLLPPTPQRDSLLARIDERNFYGWMDYGDVPIDFEDPSGQWGMKYDMDFHMAQQYARSLRPEWWALFAAAARHTRDIDVHHQPHYPALHFVKGGVWAHSLHNEPGHKNPHRNYNHFTKDLAFGARGTAAWYHLTGDWKSRDACLEIAENALADYMSPQQDPGEAARNNRMGIRGDACTLNRLLEGYLLSGDEKYLRHARWQIRSCAFNGKPAKHEAISLWSSLFYMMALARWVEMFPDDADATSYLLAHLETLHKAIDPAHGIYYTITPRPDGGAAAPHVIRGAEETTSWRPTPWRSATC